MSLVNIIIIGCGNRGSVYASYTKLHPDRCKVVAIAEPRDTVRNIMKETYQIPDEHVFKDWESILKLPKFADAVFICTPDRLHTKPAIAFANAGYHILLEKPMAPTKEECYEVYNAVVKNNIIFAIGHVMRYTPYTAKLREIIQQGDIGEIVSIQHLEPIGFFHFSHSYVRGNWGNSNKSSPMLLAKCCHDIDWLLWITGKKCLKISSFGSLKYFVPKNKPEGSGTRCLECSVEESCPYSSKKIYLDTVKRGYTGWPVHIITEDVPTPESVEEALRNGPYGRCVYDCDNDVLDNQVVNMMLEDNITISFSVVAFTEKICQRQTRIWGTKGELEGNGNDIITVYDFLTLQKTTYNPEEPTLGHLMGDYGLMGDFIEAVSSNDTSFLKSTPLETLQSHLIVFAAEEARINSTVLDLNNW